MNKQKTKKTIGNIFYILFIVILLFITLFVLQGRINNKATFLFDRTIVYILSPSMEQTIPEKSYILVEKVDPSQVEEGDIIVFYSDDPALSGALNTHRVLEKKENNSEFVTKGDNNLTPDKHTAKADKIVGRYLSNLSLLTAVMGFFMTRVGIVILVLLFVGFTASVYIPDLIKKGEERRKSISDTTIETTDMTEE